MKTIDVLVEELPKRGGWPYGAIGAGFLSGEGTLYFWDKNNDCPPKWIIDTDIEVEDSDEEVTREQYEAALAAKNEGWIEWGGGKPPVDNVTVVDIKFRSGETASGVEAGKYYWPHTDYEHDIIAYRLHQSQEAAQAKADDEADLNECIGQDDAPVWNGEGLPPVGCECEFISNDTSWGAVVVIGMDGDKVVIKPSGETYYGITLSERQVFRPIRSEADRKRDESLRVIYEILDAGTSTKQDAADIYDAIAAGKIPGVKLED